VVADQPFRFVFGLLIGIEEPLSHFELMLEDGSFALAGHRRGTDIEKALKVSMIRASPCELKYAPCPLEVDFSGFLERVIEADGCSSMDDMRGVPDEGREVLLADSAPVACHIAGDAAEPQRDFGDSEFAVQPVGDCVDALFGALFLSRTQKERDCRILGRAEEPGKKIQPDQTGSARDEEMRWHSDPRRWNTRHCGA
jgi:hypothetical protein